MLRANATPAGDEGGEEEGGGETEDGTTTVVVVVVLLAVGLVAVAGCFVHRKVN